MAPRARVGCWRPAPASVGARWRTHLDGIDQGGDEQVVGLERAENGPQVLAHDHEAGAVQLLYRRDGVGRDVHAVEVGGDLVPRARGLGAAVHGAQHEPVVRDAQRAGPVVVVLAVEVVPRLVPERVPGDGERSVSNVWTAGLRRASSVGPRPRSQRGPSSYKLAARIASSSSSLAARTASSSY